MFEIQDKRKYSKKLTVADVKAGQVLYEYHSDRGLTIWVIIADSKDRSRYRVINLTTSVNDGATFSARQVVALFGRSYVANHAVIEFD